jgi:hypothetical protein
MCEEIVIGIWEKVGLNCGERQDPFHFFDKQMSSEKVALRHRNLDNMCNNKATVGCQDDSLHPIKSSDSPKVAGDSNTSHL